MSGIKNTLQNNSTAQANTAFLQELKSKLPHYFTAEKIETIELDSGQTETKVLQAAEFQIDKFLADLAQNNISEARDGYRLSFVGKDYARLQTGMASETVIVPDTEHNQKAENLNSQNVFMTGDNLEALRHLQNAYAGAVKMIYIDPPYNTGKEFVYNDKFDFSDEKLKSQLGYSDEEIARLKSIQGKSSHSAWLTFMYPRLKIAQKLLSDDGVIFVSIDDNEQANLKLLMDDVFGEGNFVASFTIASNSAKNNSKKVSISHEYLLCYVKSLNKSQNEEWLVSRNNSDEFVKRTKKLLSNGLSDEEIHKELLELVKYPRFYEFDHYTYVDEKGPFRASDLTAPESKVFYEIFHPISKKPCKTGTRGWGFSEKSMKELIDNNRILWGKDESIIPQLKNYLFENIKTLPKSILFFDSQSSTKWMKSNNFGFDFAKSVDYLKYIISIIDDKNAIILDFFAGSSTTADAVMQMNANDGGSRKYIMVQWDEPTNPDSPARPEYQTIDQISRERIKRAAAKIRAEKPDLAEQIDLGFKHYRLATPKVQTLEQIETFDPSQQDLFAHDMLQPFSATALNVDGAASGVDTLLQTWLMNDGHPFNTAIEVIQLADYQAHYLKHAQTLYLLAPDFNAQSLKALLNQIGTHQLLVSSIILYPYSFSFTELQQLKTNIKTNLDHAPQIIERF